MTLASVIECAIRRCLDLTTHIAILKPSNRTNDGNTWLRNTVPLLL